MTDEPSSDDKEKFREKTSSSSSKVSFADDPSQKGVKEQPAAMGGKEPSEVTDVEDESGNTDCFHCCRGMFQRYNIGSRVRRYSPNREESVLENESTLPEMEHMTHDEKDHMKESVTVKEFLAERDPALTSKTDEAEAEASEKFEEQSDPDPEVDQAETDKADDTLSDNINKSFVAISNKMSFGKSDKATILPDDQDEASTEFEEQPQSSGDSETTKESGKMSAAISSITETFTWANLTGTKTNIPEEEVDKTEQGTQMSPPVPIPPPSDDLALSSPTDVFERTEETDSPHDDTSVSLPNCNTVGFVVGADLKAIEEAPEAGDTFEDEGAKKEAKKGFLRRKFGKLFSKKSKKDSSGSRTSLPTDASSTL